MGLVLSMTGLLVIAGVIGVGAYALARRVTLKETADRYQYVVTRDIDGNVITKVVDLQDKTED